MFYTIKRFKELSEKEILNIIEKACNGDERAFNTLKSGYDKHVQYAVEKTLTTKGFHTILSVNYKFTAEEITSETWLQCYKGLKKDKIFTSSSKFKSYLWTIASSEAKTYMDQRIEVRKQMGTKDNLLFQSLEDSLDEDLKTVHVQGSENDLIKSQHYSQLLEVLTEREKNILRLTLANFSQEYIAEELGKTVKTIFNDIKNIEIKSKELKML